jgi:hypothetical protein
MHKTIRKSAFDMKNRRRVHLEVRDLVGITF